MIPPDTSRPDDASPVVLPLWRNRDYLLRWSGQVVSNLGSQIAQFAFPLLMLSLTGSAAQAGFAAALRIVPYLLLSLPAGALVDRWNRKRTMILCDIGRAGVFGSVPLALWTHHMSVAQLYVVSVVDGMLMVFFSLALTASLPRVVSKEQLPAAMGQDSASYQIAGLIAPPVGGLLYGIGKSVPFLVDAISFTASVVSLFFIRAEFQEQRTAAPRSLRREIVEGLVWLWNQPLVRTMGFLSAIAWIMLTALDLVVIVSAREHHASSLAIGVIFAIGGVGGIAGALLAGHVQRRFGFGPVVIGCAWIWAAMWPLYALAPNLIALGCITAALFVVWPIYNVVQMSYRIALIPDDLQGRVNSAFRLIAFSGQPIGFALSGTLLQIAGTRSTVLILALAPLGMAVAANASKSVRLADPLLHVRAA
ncbi:MAG: MFS transporter [Chloroflexota bacterium]